MSTDARIRSVLQDMEEDVHAVASFARLLCHLAATPNMIEADCINCICGPLLAVGNNLEDRFNEAFVAAGGRV
ncbi:hypothetical protein [Methylobacterium haplocladii]|uniref:Uncharacterized protein n=1 Tax=Methylobacterium haplocladii TaxID=1176176 RepID=A0A512IW29_9HYPH|nr:hypothetical protein [Methylobacterium haplocladii]GEP01895.1 hypothetical protein MHA02_42820 [Methylobacterium haplocladii]GJD85763.1 hypothetical protein HPGCJGGD_3655 [Methylobacterium haplocladii]GLS59849.1 hypothetical protein GCM10007887_25220 [Methylobacterium haplocladii]